MTKRRTRRKPRSVDDQVLVAHHEAGHAVAAWRSRLRFTKISIVGDETSSGRVTPELWARFRPDVDNSKRTNALTERLIMVLYAGNVAQASVLKASIFDKRAERGCVDDFERAMAFAQSMCGDEFEGAALAMWLRHSARTTLNVAANWLAVTTLANELVLHRELSGAQARRTIRMAVRSVDSASPWGAARP